MKKKKQSNGSAEKNQQDEFQPVVENRKEAIEQAFKKRNTATRYLQTGERIDLARRIGMKCRKKGMEPGQIVPIKSVGEALEIKNLETQFLLYAKHELVLCHSLKDINKTLNDLEGKAIEFDIIERDDSKKFWKNAGNIAKGYLESQQILRPLMDWIDKEKEQNHHGYFVSESDLLKAFGIQEAQITYEFYKKYELDIFDGEKDGIQLKKEALEHFDKVCDKSVPRRLQKQVDIAKAQNEE